MDEKPSQTRYIDQPHYDSGDYSWPPNWYPGLVLAAGTLLNNNTQEPRTVVEELPE